MLHQAISFGHYRLDPRERTDVRRDAKCGCTPKALALLSFLAERPGEVVTKDELFAAVWPKTEVGDAALVTVHPGTAKSASAIMPDVRVISRRCTGVAIASSRKCQRLSGRLTKTVGFQRCHCPTVPRSRCCHSPI